MLTILMNVNNVNKYVVLVAPSELLRAFFVICLLQCPIWMGQISQLNYADSMYIFELPMAFLLIKHAYIYVFVIKLKKKFFRISIKFDVPPHIDFEKKFLDFEKKFFKFSSKIINVRPKAKKNVIFFRTSLQKFFTTS